ncbi:MAG: hypothetical protein SYR96_37105 [Actinomycetota bacterium]|nr:hypothetical protein [Actinomycetota bacterium]
MFRYATLFTGDLFHSLYRSPIQAGALLRREFDHHDAADLVAQAMTKPPPGR